MTNYNERLDEILQGELVCISNDPQAYVAGIEDTKQAILRWVADEVIGEDQPDIGKSSHERNILRRQLREILAEHGYKGYQR